MAWGWREKESKGLSEQSPQAVPEQVTISQEYQAFSQMKGEEFESQSMEAGAVPLTEPEPAAAVLTKDDFFALFKGTFDIAGHVTRLQSLGVADDPTARPASDAIYDIAAEVPALRWLIQPEGVWMQRCIAIGMFTVPKALAVKAELMARKPKPQPKKQEPANNNTAAALEAKREPIIDTGFWG